MTVLSLFTAVCAVVSHDVFVAVHGFLFVAVSSCGYSLRLGCLSADIQDAENIHNNGTSTRKHSNKQKYVHHYKNIV
jgi:hypothetical protein